MQLVISHRVFCLQQESHARFYTNAHTHTHIQLSCIVGRVSFTKWKIRESNWPIQNAPEMTFFGNRQMSKKKEIKLMFSDRNNEEIISWLYHQQGVKYFVVFGLISMICFSFSFLFKI